MSVIELPVFEKLKRDAGADFVGELIEAYAEETPQLIAKLRQALLIQDAEAFQQAAHSIKSTSNTFGALSLGEIAKDLEMAGRAANFDAAPEKVNQLAAEYDRVLYALEELSHG